MVAITVVLAAVIGAMVFGLTDDIGDTGPSATLSFDDGDGEDAYFFVIHDGGETLETEELAIIVDGSTQEAANFSGMETISSGERVEIAGEIDSALLDDDRDVAVRHDPSGSTLWSGNVNVTDIN